MSEIIFEALKLVVMLAVLVFTRYLVPIVKNKLGNDKLETITNWTKYAVLKAQQVMQAEEGVEKKAYVTEFLKKLLQAKDISLSDEQLDVLIEAAVKEMKMEENEAR